MKYPRIQHFLYSSLLISMMSSCGDMAPFPGYNNAEEEGEVTITLHVPADGSSNATRGLPTGGENGDGREAGLENENSVKDANIFFFEANSLNPDSPESIDVTCVYVDVEDEMVTFNSDDDDDPFEKRITIKIKTSDTALEESEILSATNVTFITVLNVGEDLSGKVSNLKELREYHDFTASRTFSDNKYSDFVMTTAYDAPESGLMPLGTLTPKVGSNRLVKDPLNAEKGWRGETTVQRLCARVDLMHNAANEKEGELLYLTDAGNKVHITNILPVNFMTSPSYLLRKVTDAIPTDWTEAGLGAITWGGVESTMAGSDLPANYVIEPTTLVKASTTATKELSQWYGSSAGSSVKTALLDDKNGKTSGYTRASLSVAEANGCNRITIIGYPDENIQAPLCYSSDFISGIALRAEFQPTNFMEKREGGYRAIPLSDNTWNHYSSSQKTFWRYMPSTSANGVKDSEALYFRTEEDVNEYAEAHASDLATVTKYENGVCYYNVWIRHYNDESYKNANSDPKSSYPMEFAVVRNNIYRVGLSFTGPGDPTPTLREPNTMMSRIFVRKWNLRTEKNPLQF